MAIVSKRHQQSSRDQQHDDVFLGVGDQLQLGAKRQGKIGVNGNKHHQVNQSYESRQRMIICASQQPDMDLRRLHMFL